MGGKEEDIHVAADEVWASPRVGREHGVGKRHGDAVEGNNVFGTPSLEEERNGGAPTEETEEKKGISVSFLSTSMPSASGWFSAVLLRCPSGARLSGVRFGEAASRRGGKVDAKEAHDAEEGSNSSSSSI